jgi:hypothetical protein
MPVHEACGTKMAGGLSSAASAMFTRFRTGLGLWRLASGLFKNLSFCEQSGAREGSFILRRLPFKTEAATIRSAKSRTRICHAREGFELIGGGGRPYPIRSGATTLAPNAASKAEIGIQDEDPVAAP